MSAVASVGGFLKKAGGLLNKEGAMLAATKGISFLAAHPGAAMAGAGALGGYMTTGHIAGALAGAGIGYMGGRKGWGKNNSSFARKMAKRSSYAMGWAATPKEGRELFTQGLDAIRAAPPKLTNKRIKPYSQMDRSQAFKKAAMQSGGGKTWGKMQHQYVQGWSRGLKMATVAGIAGVAAGGVKMAWGVGSDVFGRGTGNSYGAERTSGYGASFSGMGNGIVGGY